MSAGKDKKTADDFLAREVKRAASEGCISCRDALALAKRLGVTPRAIGRAADCEGVKIVHCQLGCFGRRRKRRSRG